MKYIIEMPDGWKPEPVALKPINGVMQSGCGKCPFRDAKYMDDGIDCDFCLPGECPLDSAVPYKE